MDKPLIQLLLGADGLLKLQAHWAIIAVGMLLVASAVAWKLFGPRGALKDFEIDETELGIGNAKFTLKPNWTDRQVAYAIWVELATRKIGLPIDLENDVLSEIYDSWFNFFTVTRELVKTIPVSKVAGPSTRKIIRISVEVLNEGLRPHLTRWQARFRRWYEKEADQAARALHDPQDIQTDYPCWDELTADLKAVNERLIAYRRTMQKIAYGEEPGSGIAPEPAPPHKDG